MDQQITNALSSLEPHLKGIELTIKRIADSMERLVEMNQEKMKVSPNIRPL